MSVNDNLVNRCQIIIEDAKMTNLTIMNDKQHTNLSLIAYKIKILTSLSKNQKKYS